MKNLEQRQETLELDHLSVRRFLEQFRDIAPLFGQKVLVTISAGSTVGKAFHSLGRPYVAGFIGYQTGGGLGESAIVAEPANAVATGLISDAAKEVYVSVGRALPVTKTFYVWLF